MATKNTRLPDGVEIFRAGKHTDDAGVVHQFSEADIAGMVSSYDPALREAPLTVGHPASNLPAYGWVEGLQVAPGGRLAMNTHNVEVQFAEMVRAKRFPKRSASFYTPDHPNNPKPGNWYLRHVAFLGAQPPAVTGLKDIAAFAADDAGTVNFSESLTAPQQENDMDKDQEIAQQKKDLEAANAKTAAAEKEAKEAKDKLAQFAEGARVARHAGHVSFAEAEVKAGRLLPVNKGSVVAVLDLLADSQPVEFSEGDTKKTITPVEFLKTLLSSTKPLVQFGEHSPGSAGAVTQGSKDMDDAQIDKLAREYMAKNKVASYSEAVHAVTATFTTST